MSLTFVFRFAFVPARCSASFLVPFCRRTLRGFIVPRLLDLDWHGKLLSREYRRFLSEAVLVGDGEGEGGRDTTKGERESEILRGTEADDATR